MEEFVLKVRRVSWLKNHERFFCHGTQTYSQPPSQFGRTFSRSFVCTCGEPLVDGDRVVDTDIGVTHVNCLGEVASSCTDGASDEEHAACIALLGECPYCKATS